jgi:polysaccharide export outer membrane protein
VRLLFLVPTLALLVAACTPGQNLTPLPSATAEDYRLGPGDVVRIITYGEEPLTGEFHVNDGGTIAVPLLGSLQATGLTPAELETEVAGALIGADILRNPSVSVEVIAYRPIFVLGEVNKPGQYPYQPAMTVVTAAAVAGGFTYRAVQSYASVVRTRAGEKPGTTVAIEGKAGRQTLVQPGDVITIFERRF